MEARVAGVEGAQGALTAIGAMAYEVAMQHRRRLAGEETQPTTVRPTVAEHAAWVEAARAEHLSLSAWIARELARASAASARRRRAAERETRGAA
jgi:hypothetical protein